MENTRLRSDAARTGRITLGSLALLCAIIACVITGQSLSQVSSGGEGASADSGSVLPDADATPAASTGGLDSIASLFTIERVPLPDGETRNAGRVLLLDAETGDVLRSLSGFWPLDGFGGSSVMIDYTGGATLAVSAMWARGSGRVYLYDIVDTLAQGPDAAPYLQIAGRVGEIFGAGLFTPAAADIADLAGRGEGVAVDAASLERRSLLGVYSVFGAGYGDGYVRRSLHDVLTGEAVLVESDESAMARGAALLGADLNRDNVVDSDDLAALLGQWGRVCSAEEAGACGVRDDLNGDGVVNAQDLAILLASWGREAVGFPDLGRDGEWAPLDQMCCLPNGICGPACICSGGCGDGGDACDPTSLNPCDEEIPCTGEGCDDEGGGGDDGGDDGPEPPCEGCPEPPCEDCPDTPCIGDNCDPCDDCDPNCHVVINGCSEWIVIPPDGEPLIFTAGAGPSDGQFSWSAAGAKIDGDGPTAEVTITQPGPVSVTVNYTVNGSTCSNTCDFEAIPFSLNTEDPVVVVNRSDTDRDGIPDYADGFGRFGAETAIGTVGNRFVPLSLSVGDLSEAADVEIIFEYSAAHPDDVMREQVFVEDIESSYYRYSRGINQLRIWKKDGSETRSLDDFIDSGDALDAADIESDLTLYVEAVNGSSIMTIITAHLKIDGVNMGSTSVEVLPFDSTTGLSVDKIDGYTIHYGSTTGTPGNDIIIGTGGDDILIGGEGDDIIVSGGGDDLIDPGPGRNYIFASRGNNEIGPVSAAAAEDGPPDGPVLRGGDDSDVILDEEDKPFTTEQVLRVYRLIYGEDDPWLDIFLNVELGQNGEHIGIGWVESVEKIGTLFQSDARISKRFDFDRDRHVWIIQLSFRLQTPFIAAMHLREKLLELVSESSVVNARYRAALINQALDKARAQDDFDEEVLAYEQLRQQAFNNAVQATSLISNVYLGSIGIFNQGADVVLGLNELSDGNLTGALACLPFISAPAISGVKSMVWKLPDGSVLLTKVGRVIKGQESGLGVIYRKGMHIEAKPVNGKSSALMGTAQNTTGLPGDPHAAITETLARQRYDSGLAEFTVMNRSLRTSTGLDTLGSQAGKFPDIVVVQRNGKVDLYEVLSPSQDVPELVTKLEEMRAALPPVHQGDIFVYGLNGNQLFPPQ